MVSYEDEDKNTENINTTTKNLNKKIETLEANNSKLNTLNNQNQENQEMKISNLKNKNADLENRNIILSQKVVGLKNQLSKNTDENTDLAVATTKQNQNIARLSSAISNLRNENTTLSQEVEKLKTKRIITIGRNKNCDIVFNSNIISKTHASIERSVNGGYILKDLNSRNGVFVNGRKIKGVAKIGLKDKIYIGRHLLSLVGRSQDLSDELAITARGIEKTYNSGEKMSMDEIYGVSEKWKPWRTVACCYMWSAVDPEPVEY